MISLPMEPAVKLATIRDTVSVETMRMLEFWNPTSSPTADQHASSGIASGVSGNKNESENQESEDSDHEEFLTDNDPDE